MRIPDPPVTLVQEVEGGLRRRRFWIVGPILLILVILAIVAIANIWRLYTNEPVRYANIGDHFKYGSIGSEPESGLPYWMWRALPIMFENELGSEGLRVFGFLYEEGSDLPIGVSRRNYRGVELAWLNCAVCHTGTYTGDDGQRHIVLGMPSNNLDFEGFVRFLFKGVEEKRLTPTSVMAGMRRAGARFGPVDWALYRFYVIPRVLAGLRHTRDGLAPIMNQQVAWGPGRVDTFNPYKVIQFNMRLDDLDPSERHGVSDLPSIFLQRPRGDQHMDLHWDGDNDSLQERNLSAAIGAGVTERTVDHVAIKRIAEWLLDLRPPPSPYKVDSIKAALGRNTYMRECADCHGYEAADGYVFAGKALGKVTSIDLVGTDRGTARFLHREASRLAASDLLQGRSGLRFHAFQEDFRLRQPAARRALAACALSSQRLGADAPRSSQSAGRATRCLRARRRPARSGEWRVPRRSVRPGSLLRAALLLRHQAEGRRARPRQPQYRPPLRYSDFRPRRRKRCSNI